MSFCIHETYIMCLVILADCLHVPKPKSRKPSLHNTGFISYCSFQMHCDGLAKNCLQLHGYGHVAFNFHFPTHDGCHRIQLSFC